MKSCSKIRNKAAFIFHCFPKAIDIPDDLQGQPVHACQTSPRLAKVLRNSGVRVLGDLDGHKVGDFVKKNCGFKTLHELDSLVPWTYGDCAIPARLPCNGEGSAKNATTAAVGEFASSSVTELLRQTLNPWS